MQEYNNLKKWLDISDNLKMIGTKNRSIVAKKKLIVVILL